MLFLLFLIKSSFSHLSKSFVMYSTIILLALTISFSIPKGNAPDPTDGSATVTFSNALSIISKLSIINFGIL